VEVATEENISEEEWGKGVDRKLIVFFEMRRGTKGDFRFRGVLLTGTSQKRGGGNAGGQKPKQVMPKRERAKSEWISGGERHREKKICQKANEKKKTKSEHGLCQCYKLTTERGAKH